MSMTGNIGFSTTVVFVTIIDRGSQSRSFNSLMSAGGSAAQTEAPARTATRARRIRVHISKFSRGFNRWVREKSSVEGFFRLKRPAACVAGPEQEDNDANDQCSCSQHHVERRGRDVEVQPAHQREETG